MNVWLHSVPTRRYSDFLYTVLEVRWRVTAPLLPLTLEEMWRGLTGGRSVHLTYWPSVEDLPADDDLVASMDVVRDVCSSTSALRKSASLRNRLPLSMLTVVVDGAESLAGFSSIVANEVNVKSVRMLDIAERSEEHTYELQSLMRLSYAVCGLKK